MEKDLANKLKKAFTSHLPKGDNKVAISVEKKSEKPDSFVVAFRILSAYRNNSEASKEAYLRLLVRILHKKSVTKIYKHLVMDTIRIRGIYHYEVNIATKSHEAYFKRKERRNAFFNAVLKPIAFFKSRFTQSAQ